MVCCPGPGGHTPVDPTATAPGPRRGAAVLAGCPLCRGRAGRGTLTPAPCSPRAGPRTGRGLHWHAHLHTRRGTLAHGALCACVCSCRGRGGCVSVCVRVRLCTGRTVAHGGAPVVWGCGHAVVNRDGRVSARPLRVSCVGVGVWVPARLFGARLGAVQPPNRWGAGESLKLFLGA